MNNDCINQLLRLPLLKHTHMHTHKITTIIIIIIIIIIKRQYQAPFPSNKHPYNTPDRGPKGNSQGIGAVKCCRKDLLEPLHS